MKRLGKVLALAVPLLAAPVLVAAPHVPLAGALSGAAFAVQPDEMLPDARLEARARAISSGLRCLVCQNQSIDDSDADLAKDLRVLVRERLAAGDSDAAVTDFLVGRYGEFVLLKPRLSAQTLLLWGTPIALLCAGALFAARSARRQRRAGAAPQMTADEEAAVARTLRDRGL